MDQSQLHKVSGELSDLLTAFNLDVDPILELTHKTFPLNETDVAKVLRFKDKIAGVDTKIEMLVAEWVLLSIQNKKQNVQGAASLNATLRAAVHAHFGLDNGVWDEYKKLLQHLIMGAFPYDAEAHQNYVNEFNYLYNEDPEKNRDRIIEIAEKAHAMEQRKQQYTNFLKSWYGEDYLENLQSTSSKCAHLV